MRRQARQHVMRVLPHGLRHDERCIGIDVAEDLDAFALTGDEAVLDLAVHRRCARATPTPSAFKRGGQRPLHRGLRRPAHLVRGESQVAAGDELDATFRRALRRHAFQAPWAAEKKAPRRRYSRYSAS